MTVISIRESFRLRRFIHKLYALFERGVEHLIGVITDRKSKDCLHQFLSVGKIQRQGLFFIDYMGTIETVFRA